jgi:hypothetical protein
MEGETTMADRRRPPSRRKAAFKAERPDTIALGVAVAAGMAMVHGEGGEVWFQSLPAADNIEACSCGAFASSPHYRLKEGFSAPADR